jgi:hypothetical protein
MAAAYAKHADPSLVVWPTSAVSRWVQIGRALLLAVALEDTTTLGK